MLPHPELTQIERRVLSYVIRLPGSHAYGLAELSGERYQTVRNVLIRLEGKGLVSSVEVPRGTRAITREYTAKLKGVRICRILDEAARVYAKGREKGDDGE